MQYPGGLLLLSTEDISTSSTAGLRRIADNTAAVTFLTEFQQ